MRIAARDLRPGHAICTRTTDLHEFPAEVRASGAWITVGEIHIDWGAVFVRDNEGRHITTYNHGDPVTIQTDTSEGN